MKDRRSIRAYWRQSPIPPQVLIEDCPTEKARSGSVGNLGDQMRCRAPYVDKRDDGVVIFLIAHELTQLQWPTTIRP